VPDNKPTVSVIIPALDAAKSLSVALTAISKQTYENIVDVVVAAGDEPTAAAARAGGAVVVDNPSGSTPIGLNRALRTGSGDVVVRCDAHSILPPHYIEDAVSALLTENAVNVGGMQIPVGETAWEGAIGEAMSSRWGAGDARYRVGGPPGPVETVYLGVFLREALNQVGGFDEDFERTQDYELNHRLIQAGGTVLFDPKLRVGYRPRGSLRSLARQYFDYGRAKRQFDHKHPGHLRPRQLAAPALVLVLASSLLLSLVWPITLIVPIGYLLTLTVVSLGSSVSFWRVAAALATMHVSWGLGFLSGRRVPGRSR
jgi:succinoglycan biosynthesis protein ExoA